LGGLAVFVVDKRGVFAVKTLDQPLTWHVRELENLYVVPHTHAHGGNIAQHRSCGEILVSHIESGVEKQSKSKTEPNPQADMLQLKNFHIPEKNKTYT
jgi:hypothetical protein